MDSDYSGKNKPQEGPCQSYHMNEKNRFIQCGAPGKRRINNSLDSGIHCDLCWDEIILDCRKRSW